MPKSHKDVSMTRLEGMKRYVASIGENAQELVEVHFRTNKRPSATATAAKTLAVLAKEYTAHRVEIACKIALTVGKPNIIKVKSILTSGVDQGEPHENSVSKPIAARKNIRGAGYFFDIIEDMTGEKIND